MMPAWSGRAPSRSPTVCSQCERGAISQFRGTSFCVEHLEAAMSRCGTEARPHDWALDSTEVFSTASGPVIRALYFCLLCGVGVVAKPAESAEEAVKQRVRERLLRIERMLAE